MRAFLASRAVCMGSAFSSLVLLPSMEGDDGRAMLAILTASCVGFILFDWAIIRERHRQQMEDER